VESVGILVKKLLTGRELFKQFVLGGAYQLSILDVALGVRCGFIARANLPVIELVKYVVHLLILQNNI